MKNHTLTTLNQSQHELVEVDEELTNPFPVSIFDADYCGETIPAGFDAVRISLDGKMKADLSWKKEFETAKDYVTQGFKIFWDIDLGLPNLLTHPLSNRAQFLSLSLSLEHFCKTLWREFRKESIGLCLFRGSLDFSKEYPWNEEQLSNLHEWMIRLYPNIEDFVNETSIELLDFKYLTKDLLSGSETGKKLLMYFCRDGFSEYLSLLSAGIPDSLPIFLMLDASNIDDSFLIAQLLNKEYFIRFHLGVKGFSVMSHEGEIAWEGNCLEKDVISREIKKPTKSERYKLALCLPSGVIYRPSATEALNQALITLHKFTLSFRIISEINLAIEWDELDYLIVDSRFVSFQFKRRLQGFCAAGGSVVYIGAPLGLAEEISFDDWLSSRLQNL